MRQRHLSLFCFSALLLYCSNQAHGYELNNRWTSTATNGSTGSQGSPVTLTWSFAPDNTLIPGIFDGSTTQSLLISFLDTNFGAGPGGSDFTQRPWYTHFQQAFGQMSKLSGVTYVYEPNDDGKAFNQFSAAGALGVRGDVRLGGRSYGEGSNTLASNYYPSYGEMMFNTDRGVYFKNTTNNFRRLRNTTMHEAMHGLGIEHVESNNAAFLIEPTLGTAFDGPQLDDILAMQRHYGDYYEKSGGNDLYTIATPLGTLSPSNPLQIGTLGDSTVVGFRQVDFVSIDDNSDTDFFSFSLTERLDVQLLLTPRGTTYKIAPQGGTQDDLNTRILNNLSLALYDTNGTSLLASADNTAAGFDEEIVRQLLPGTYFARVKGTLNDIQLYGLNLFGTVPGPGNLLWVGNLGPNWITGNSNFTKNGSPVGFYPLDNVTFNDTSIIRVVNLPSDISAGEIRVTTASSYTFTGPGGLVAGSLTVDGTGTVEFANSGNSYEGSTQVLAGTLQLTGSGTLSGNVQVADSATLEVGENYDFQTTAQLSGDGVIRGNIEMPGTISPGSTVGTLHFENDLTLYSTTQLEIQIDASSGDIQHDSLAITGSALLGGVLDVALVTSELPVLNSIVEVLFAEGGIIGEFDDILLPSLGDELAWSVLYGDFSMLLQVVDTNATVLPGDFNHDGSVDAADYVVWRKNIGDAGSYDLWYNNFGAMMGSGGGSTNTPGGPAVPEPAGFVLALLGSIMAIFVKRR
jgi:serralysin